MNLIQPPCRKPGLSLAISDGTMFVCPACVLPIGSWIFNEQTKRWKNSARLRVCGRRTGTAISELLTAGSAQQHGPAPHGLDVAPLLMGWICRSWNLRNRLFLVLSPLCCLWRIWPFGRSVSWCTLKSCRWVGIRAKTSNTSQPCSYPEEQQLFAHGWLTATRPRFSVLHRHSFLWRLFVGVQKRMSDSSPAFSSRWNPCATLLRFIQVFVWPFFNFPRCSLLGEAFPRSQ